MNKQTKRYTAHEPTTVEGKHATQEMKSSKRKDKGKKEKKAKHQISPMQYAQYGQAPMQQPGMFNPAQMPAQYYN